MTEEKIGIHRKIMGTICHHCPICKYGRNNPDSIVGKILHHKLHADYCPMWKAEKELYENQRIDK